MDDASNTNIMTERKILMAAREVFAEKGYDGASIAQIAARAGVNKALPFYYFKSKENILKKLMQLGAQETLERKEMLMKKTNPFVKESIEEYYENMLELMEQRKEIIKIILSESFKGTNEASPLFVFLDPILQDIASKFKKSGIETGDEEGFKTSELFFDVLPLFNYIALAEKWAAHNNSSAGKVKKDFMESYKAIFINYLHEKYFKGKR